MDKSGSETATIPSSSLHQEEVGVASSSHIPPPPNFLSSPPTESSPHEFATADFYIDESMPSSCAGSNDTSTAAAVLTPHLELLQLKAEALEKDTLINLLQVPNICHHDDSVIPFHTPFLQISYIFCFVFLKEKKMHVNLIFVIGIIYKIYIMVSIICCYYEILCKLCNISQGKNILFCSIKFF